MKNIFIIVLLIITNSLFAQREYYITSSDSTKLFVREFGTGEPIILLAGGPGLNAVYMKPVWENLASKYRCIVLDQRGTGKSKIAKADSIILSLNNYVADIETLRKTLNIDRIILIGHSWGGKLSMEYAGLYPQHVQKLILLDPGGLKEEFFIRFRDNLMMRLRDEDFKEIAQLDSLKKSRLKGLWPGYFYDRKRAMATKNTTDFEELIGDYPAIPYYLHPSVVASENGRIERLKNFKNTVYIIQGRQDPTGESTAFEIKEVLPQAKIYFIEKCGHMPWLENSEQVQYFFSMLNESLK